MAKDADLLEFCKVKGLFFATPRPIADGDAPDGRAGLVRVKWRRQLRGSLADALLEGCGAGNLYAGGAVEQRSIEQLVDDLINRQSRLQFFAPFRATAGGDSAHLSYRHVIFAK